MFGLDGYLIGFDGFNGPVWDFHETVTNTTGTAWSGYTVEFAKPRH